MGKVYTSRGRQRTERVSLTMVGDRIEAATFTYLGSVIVRRNVINTDSNASE